MSILTMVILFLIILVLMLPTDYGWLRRFFKKILTLRLAITSRNDELEQSENDQEGISAPKFQPLTPVDDADQDGVYENAILYALENQDIKNIALTGSYGSGKSSVIKTFQRKHNHKWRFLNISLATFKDINDQQSSSNEDQQNTDDGATEVDINSIEKSILQQLFYAVRQDTIPRSRFKRITTPKNDKPLWKCAFVMIWAFSLTYLFGDLKNNLDFISFADWYDICNLFLFTTFSFAFLKFFYDKALIIQELKFKFHDTEINLKDEQAHSIINKHLDEVLYFFEMSDYDVLVIEDLDRFNNSEIFIRLRELNSIINNSEDVGRRIVFLYAIKDEMFLNKERSKFFDFIVPIIPVVNPTNAYDKIIERYDVTGIDQRFLSKVSLYFDDLRLVFNIFNEFEVYRDKLIELNLDKNKLLAIIIYKNYHPKDFSLISSSLESDSLIYSIFRSKKKKVINDKVSLDRITIQNLEQRIEQIESEHVTSIEALKKSYISEILKKIIIEDPLVMSNQFSHITIDGDQYSTDTFMQTENFEKIQNSSSIVVKVVQNNGYNRQLSSSPVQYSSLEARLGLGSYAVRSARIEDKTSGFLKDLRDQVLSIEKKIEYYDKKISLLDLFEEFEPEEFFDGAESELVRFLVRFGYIDENYKDYISIFYATSITLSDRNFALNLSNRGEPMLDVSLTNIDALLERFIDPDDLDEESVLNFSLLEALLRRKDKYPNQLTAFIKTLSNYENSITFIKELISREIEIKQLVTQINDHWQGFYDGLLSSSLISEDERESIFWKIIPLLSQEDVVNDFVRNPLSSFIGNDASFIEHSLAGFGDDHARLKTFIQSIGHNFGVLICPESDAGKDIFNYIYRNRFSIFDLDVVSKIIEVNSNISPEKIHDSLNSRPISFIKHHAPGYLADRFNEDGIQFIKNVFGDEILIEDVEGDIIEVIKSKLYTSAELDWFIGLLDCQLDEDIVSVPTEALKAFVKHGKIKGSWENCASVYEKFSGTDNEDIIVNLLNLEHVHTVLSQVKIKDIQDADLKEMCEKIERRLLTDLLVEDATFSSLTKSFYKKWSFRNLSFLGSYKTAALIENGVIAYNEDCFKAIKAIGDSSLLGAYLRLNPDWFRKEIQNGCEYLEISDYELFMSSAQVDPATKIQALNAMPDSAFDQSKILRDKFVQHALGRDAEFTKLEKILPHLPDQQKKEAVRSQLKYVSSLSHVTTLLHSLGGNYAALAADTTRQEFLFEANAYNREIFSILNDIRYINRPELRSKPKKGLVAMIEAFINNPDTEILVVKKSQKAISD